MFVCGQSIKCRGRDACAEVLRRVKSCLQDDGSGFAPSERNYLQKKEYGIEIQVMFISGHGVMAGPRLRCVREKTDV